MRREHHHRGVRPQPRTSSAVRPPVDQGVRTAGASARGDDAVRGHARVPWPWQRVGVVAARRHPRERAHPTAVLRASPKHALASCHTGPHLQSVARTFGCAERPERVWKAATNSKADARQQQDWILKGLQGGRARPLAACRVATLLLLSPAAENRNRNGLRRGVGSVGVKGEGLGDRVWRVPGARSVPRNG